MKSISKKRKTMSLILLCLFGMMGMGVSAQSCWVDGIYYEIRAEMAFVFGHEDLETYTIASTVACEGHVYNVVAIGGGAFLGDGTLREIHLSNTIGTIASIAFSGCYNLKSITLPNSVWEISAEAFASSGLTSITIPSSVSSLSHEAFNGCADLKSINVVVRNPYYSSRNGILYNKEQTTLMKCPGNIPYTSFDIPNGVKTICSYAFSDCVNMTQITIPSSVTAIGNGAFMGCGATEIRCLATTPPSVGDTPFTYEGVTLHVLEGYRDVYAADEKWGRFTIVDDILAIPNCVSIDASGNIIRRVLSYDDNENNTITLTDGYRELEVTYDIPLKTINYTRTFNNTNWQALYVPFEIPITSDFLSNFEVAYINNVHQYDDDDDGSIDRTIVEFFKMKSGTLKANFPYVIRAKAKGTKTITVNETTLFATEENSVDCRSTQYEYTFTGSYSYLTEGELSDCYAMSGGGWKTLSAGSYLNALRVYLNIEARQSGMEPIKSIGMRFIGEDGNDDEEGMTGVDQPLTIQQTGTVYDLQGRKVDNPSQGIYIINGKTILKK